MAKISNTAGSSNIWLGSNQNSRQSIVYIPASIAVGSGSADKPGLLFLESIASTGLVAGLGGVYLWADDTDALRYSATYPTDQNSNGSVIGTATGASLALDNLASVAINTALLDDIAGQDDFGSATKYWKDLWFGGDIYRQSGTFDIKLDFSTPAADRVYTVPDAGAAANIMLDTGAATGITYTKSTANITLGLAASLDIGAAGTLDVGTGTVAFNGTSTFDVATAIAINIDNAMTVQGDVSITGGAFTVSAACTLDQNLAQAQSPTWVGLTLTGAIATPTNVTMSGYLLMGDDQQIRMGGSGASDSYIQYDSSNNWLEFYDANAGGPYSLAQLVAGTPLNPIVVGDLTISDGQFDWTNATAGDVNTWTFASATTDCIDIVADSKTTGIILDIQCDAITSASVIEIDTNQGASFSGKFLNCISDGTNSDFMIEKYGATTILGTAIGTAALTLTEGDVIVTDGRLRIDIATSGAANGHIFNTDDDGTGNIPLLTLISTSTSNDQPLLKLDAAPTGDINVLEVVNDGTGFGASLDLKKTDSEGLEVIFLTASTANGILIDGNTGTYVGADTYGMLKIHQSGTLAHANTSALFIDFDGVPASNSVGHCIHVDDDSTVIGGSAAVGVNTLANVPMKLETQAVGVNTLILEATAAQIVSTLLVDGASNDWDGANLTGMVHISQDAAMIHGGASCLYVAHSGTPITAATGFMAAFVDTGANQAGVYGVDINSTSNHPLRVRTGAVGVNPVTILPHTNATASGLIVNGNTNSWLGAAATGLVQITQLGTFADATASALFIDVNGDAAAGGEGYALNIDDESDTTGGGEYAVYVNSKAGSPMKLEGQAAAMSTLVLEAGALQTVATLMVDGDTNNWTGADNQGMVTIQNDSTAQNAGASLLVLDMNGQGSSGMEGTCFRALDTGSAAAGTSYVAEIASTNNNALQISTGAAAKAALTVIPHTNATASAVIIDGNTNGWGGASNVGMVHLKNDIAGLNANASSLLITKDANTVAEVASAEGSCLRIVENMNVSGTPPAYAMYISCVDNEALHVDSGNVVVDEYVTAGVAGSTTGGLVTAYYSANLTDTPTNAEFDTGFGSAALAQAGFVGVAYDTSLTKTYLVVSDGSDWYYTTVMTKAT